MGLHNEKLNYVLNYKLTLASYLLLLTNLCVDVSFMHTRFNYKRLRKNTV